MQYSVYNKNSLLVLSDNKELHNALYRGIGGKYYSKLKDGGSGWIIPKYNEPQLIKLIELNTIKDHARGEKNRHKYHRATSDSEDEEPEIIDGGPGTYPSDEGETKMTQKSKTLAYYKEFSKSPSVSSQHDSESRSSNEFPDPDKENKSSLKKKPLPPQSQQSRYYTEDRYHDKRRPDDRRPDYRYDRDRRPNDRYDRDRRPDDRRPDDRRPDDRRPDDRRPDDRRPDDRRPDDRRPDDRYDRDRRPNDRYDDIRHPDDRYDDIRRPDDRYDRDQRYYSDRRHDDHAYTRQYDDRYPIQRSRPLPPLRRR